MQCAHKYIYIVPYIKNGILLLWPLLDLSTYSCVQTIGYIARFTWVSVLFPAPELPHNTTLLYESAGKSLHVCSIVLNTPSDRYFASIMAVRPLWFLMFTSILGCDRSIFTQSGLSLQAAKCRAVSPSWWLEQ